MAKEAVETLQPPSAFLLRMKNAQRVGGLQKGNMARVNQRRGEGAGARGAGQRSGCGPVVQTGGTYPVGFLGVNSLGAGGEAVWEPQGPWTDHY